MAVKNDFSQGSIFRGVILFSLPLILTNLLQTLFTMTDSAVLGRFAGASSVGAVGSTVILVFLSTGIVVGFGSAVNVIVAFFIGTKSDRDIRETVSTSAVVCLAAGSAVCVLGNIFARPVLELMRTKEILIDGAALYFKIYMLGMPALAFYNFGNGILSAEGDTKSPLFFLLTGGMFNVVLDFFLVVYLKMSIAGVAVASIVSLYVSALLVGIKLCRRTDSLALKISRLQVNREKLFRLLKIGIPAGLQNAVFGFANIFIQVGVNSFDASMVIANSAASNSDPLVYNVMSAFYVACSTFIGQNYGAGKKKRVLHSLFVCLFCSFFSAAVIGLFLFVFGEKFIFFFIPDARIAALGMKRLSIMSCSYCVSAFMDCSISASRGLGQTAVPTIIVLLGSCVFRIVWIYTVFAYFRTIESLYLLFVFSWTITALAESFYFARLYRSVFPAET
ncbi:MATE family efflux transporter [Treponema sp.]|uniref:MATE family efflux transporter n=1 Tax=Treponema sp. TaxID=166 RepID=UPI003F00174D